MVLHLVCFVLHLLIAGCSLVDGVSNIRTGLTLYSHVLTVFYSSTGVLTCSCINNLKNKVRI